MNGDTYRAVYTVKFEGCLSYDHLLHPGQRFTVTRHGKVGGVDSGDTPRTQHLLIQYKVSSKHLADYITLDVKR